MVFFVVHIFVFSNFLYSAGENFCTHPHYLSADISQKIYTQTTRRPTERMVIRLADFLPERSCRKGEGKTFSKVVLVSLHTAFLLLTYR